MMESYSNKQPEESKAPDLSADEIAWTYCANEIYAGYACRIKGCPTCGGPNCADAVIAELNKYMRRDSMSEVPDKS